MYNRASRRRYCRCGTLLARDNAGRQCARCERASRGKLIAPPELPPTFWQTEQFREAFADRHMGRISRAYRMHPHHHATYGPAGITQTLLAEWLGVQQAQISRIESGPPQQHLDLLQRWARTLRIPAALLWFRLPDDTTHLTAIEPAPTSQNTPSLDPANQAGNDPVLSAEWNHRGTVDVVVGLSGGERVRRLIHEPEPLIAGLSGQRISPHLATQFSAMITELRKMDDVAGGGSVLPLAQQQFGWIAGLLDRASYDDPTGRTLHTALAELGQFCGWAAYDAGNLGLAQRYNIAGLRAAHTADNRPLGSYILARMAKQAACQGHAAEAATLADTALAGMRGHQTPRLLAHLHVRRAYAAATLRDRSACTEAISEARALVEQFDSGDDPSWLYWVTPAWVTVEAGDCWLRLEKVAQAAAMLHEGITLFDESFARDRQLYTVHLADALTRPGKQHDLDLAAELGMASIDWAESLDSTVSADRLRDLRRRMEPHADVPAVRDFLERAKTSSSNGKDHPRGMAGA